MAAAQAAAILVTIVTGLEQVMQVDQVAAAVVIGQAVTQDMQVVLALLGKGLLVLMVLNQVH
jgi:hypothetical protein